MTIPQNQMDIHQFEHYFPLPLASRVAIVGSEQAGYFAGRILGCYADERRYLNLLYEYRQQSEWTVLYQAVMTTPKVSAELCQQIQHCLRTSPTIETAIMHLIGQNVLPIPQAEQFQQHYFQAYVQGLQRLMTNEHHLMEAILYLRTYLPAQAFDAQTWPHFVWYGPMNQAQAHFLSVCLLLHFDVLIFAPNRVDYLAQFIPECVAFSQVANLEAEMEVVAFPTRKLNLVATSAQSASEEMDRLFGDEFDHFYRPWQLRTYRTESIQVMTTSDEVLMMLQQPAYLRPGFAVTGQCVTIPVLFTKLNGIESVEQCETLIEQLRALPNTVVLETFPFMPPIRANYTRYLAALRMQNGVFLAERFMQAVWWRYQSLSIALQKQIIQAMIATLTDETLLIPEQTRELKQAFILGVLIDLPDPFILQLEKFDYAQAIPKVIAIHSQSGGLIRCEDAVVFRFLHHLGYDIISINPSSRSDLDRYVVEATLQIHQLPQHWFEYPKPKKGLKRKWFGRG